MQRMTRRQAIGTLRRCFVWMTDGQHSMCAVADRLGIYCGGFAGFSYADLKRRYYWIVHAHPDITRDELLRMANLWQLGRQDMLGTTLSCDSQSIEHDTCSGWDEHSDSDLARWLRELTGQEVEVGSSRTPGGARPGLAGVVG